MNLSEKSAFNWCLVFLKLAPLFILFAGISANLFNLTEFVSYLPNFSFTTDIANYLTSVMGLQFSIIFELVLGYFNYLVMFHLCECLFEVIVFLPHLFINFIQKFYRS